MLHAGTAPERLWIAGWLRRQNTPAAPVAVLRSRPGASGAKARLAASAPYCAYSANTSSASSPAPARRAGIAEELSLREGDGDCRTTPGSGEVAGVPCGNPAPRGEGMSCFISSYGLASSSCGGITEPRRHVHVLRFRLNSLEKKGLLKIGKPETKPFENGHFRGPKPRGYSPIFPKIPPAAPAIPGRLRRLTPYGASRHKRCGHLQRFRRRRARRTLKPLPLFLAHVVSAACRGDWPQNPPA